MTLQLTLAAAIGLMISMLRRQRAMQPIRVRA
jgi:hypothetical protein